MEGQSTSKAQQSKLEPSSLDQRSRRLIDDRQILHLVLSSPELLNDMNILDQPVHSKDRYGEGDGSREKVRELGKGEMDGRIVQVSNKLISRFLRGGRKKLSSSSWCDKRGVLNEVSQDPSDQLWNAVERKRAWR